MLPLEGYDGKVYQKGSQNIISIRVPRNVDLHRNHRVPGPGNCSVSPQSTGRVAQKVGFRFDIEPKPTSPEWTQIRQPSARNGSRATIPATSLSSRSRSTRLQNRFGILTDERRRVGVRMDVDFHRNQRVPGAGNCHASPQSGGSPGKWHSGSMSSQNRPPRRELKSGRWRRRRPRYYFTCRAAESRAAENF